MSSHYAPQYPPESQYPPGYQYAPQTQYLTPQQAGWASRDPGFIGASFRDSPVSYPKQPTTAYTQEDYDNAMASWTAATTAAGYGSPNSTSTYSFCRSPMDNYGEYQHYAWLAEVARREARNSTRSPREPRSGRLYESNSGRRRESSPRREHKSSSRREHESNSGRRHESSSRREHESSSRRRHESSSRRSSRREHESSSRRKHESSSRREHESGSRREHRDQNASKRRDQDKNASRREHAGEDQDERPSRYHLNHDSLVKRGLRPEEVGESSSAAPRTENVKEEKSSSPSTLKTQAAPRPVTVEDGSEEDEKPEKRGKAAKKVSFAEGEPTILNRSEAGDDEEKKKKGQLPRIDEKDPFKEVKQTLRPMNEKWAEWPSSPAVYRRRDLNVKVSPDIESKSFEPQRPAPVPSGSRSRSGSYTRVSPPRVSPSRVPPPSEVPLSAPLPPASRPKEPCATAPSGGGRPQSSGGPNARRHSVQPPPPTPRTANARPQMQQRDDRWYHDGRHDDAARELEKEKEYVRRQREEMLRSPHNLGRSQQQNSPHGSLDEALEELDRRSARPSFNRKRSDDSLHVADGSNMRESNMWESGSESDDGSLHVNIKIPSDFGSSPALRGETASFRLRNKQGVSYRLDLTHEYSPPPSPPLERDWIRDRERREREWEQEDDERKSSKKEGKKRAEGFTDRLRNRFR